MWLLRLEELLYVSSGRNRETLGSSEVICYRIEVSCSKASPPLGEQRWLLSEWRSPAAKPLHLSSQACMA
jgi:hypothetical protein